MGKKKLTQQQKLQLQENEKFQKQQRSIQLLSIPNPLKRVSSDEGEFDSPRKANDGLHLVHEHPVITRDQPLPQVKKYPQNQNEVKGWNSSKDELNLAQHGLIDKKPDLYKGAINSKGSKEDQYIINKFKNEGDSDVGGFNIYSKNDLGEYVEEELLKEESEGESIKKQNENQMNKTLQDQQWSKEKMKQIKKYQTIDQNRKSFAQIVFSPSALKRGYGVGHANQYIEGVSPPPSQLSVVNFHNYQKQNSRRVDYSEDVIQRMQTHQMNKESKKLQNERKNFDLIQVNKEKKLRGSNHMATLSDFNKSFQQIGGHERIQSQEQQQINKEDTNRSIQLINQQSLNSPFTQPKKPNLKQQFKDKIAIQQSSDQEFNENSFENDYDELESDFKKQKQQQKLDTDPDNMRKSYYKQIQIKKSKKKSQLEIKQLNSKQKKKKNSQMETSDLKIRNFSQIEKKSVKHQSPDASPLKNRNSNISIKQFDTSQMNSNSKHDVQKYVKDELEIFNTAKVNQRNNQNFNTINEFGEIVERELNQKNNPENQTLFRETDGMYMTLTSADIKGKHKPYQYVQKNIQQEFQDKIDKRLRYIMYTYTKNQEDIPNAMRQKVDHGGIRFLQEKSKFTEKGEKKLEDFFNEGIMTAQDKKISNMRNKLNHSVDLVKIQERVIEREKRKYNEKPIYKQVTNKLTFQNDQFLQNIDKILDPKNSPILPAIIANEKIKQERKSQLEENHEVQNIKSKDENQLYSSNLPLVEEFQMQFEASKKQKVVKKKQQNNKHDIAQVHNQYKESLKNQIQNKKKDKNGNVETFSKYSNESDLINENENEKKEISFEDLQEYTNLSDLIEKSQQITNNEDPLLEAPIKHSKIIAMTKEKEQKEYSVVLNKNKQPKRRDSMVYIDLDNKQDDIKNQRIKIENIEEMEQIEKVFKMIHDYCAENLSVSYNMIDKHIDDMLDPKVTVSPLLKYFNELAKHCNFRLPCLSLLQFDQKYFKAYVQRLRDAQKMEVKWVRQSVVNESREMLEYAFNQAKQLLQTEVKHIIYEYDLLKIKIKELEQTNLKLNETIYQQELSLMEQRTYILQLQQRSTGEDQELFKINNGPGGNYDKMVQGDVINNIDAYNQNLTKNLQDFAFFLKIQMAEKYEKDQQLERDGKSYLSQIKIIPTQNQDDKKKSALGIQGRENKLNYTIKKSQNTLQSQKEDEESQFQQSAKMSLFATLSKNIQNINIETSITPDQLQAQNEQIFQQLINQKESLPPLKRFYWEDDIPKIDYIQQYQLEPFLRPQYNLYGGLIRIKMQDISEIMSSEMYKYQKVQINQCKENNEALKSENFAIHEMLHQYGITNQRLKKENEDYIQTISDMKKEFDKLTKRIRQDAEKQIDEIEKKCKEDMRKLKSFLTLEINVATSIKDMIIDQNKWQAEKLRKFGTLLRVPRIHFEYIEKHGIDEFVEFCEDVMKRERALQENKQSIQKRTELRNQFSIMKIKKFADKKSSPLALKYESLTDRIIEHPFRLELQQPIEDLSKMDPQDLAQLKMQRQMEKINWLQKKSVLDLSELISKHKDRQPELLAMIHPDIKTQILSNTHFFQNLESLERKDPINKKVKDIKLFIQAIKSQTYDKHFQGLATNQNESIFNDSDNLINLQFQRNKLSKSMNLKSGLYKNKLKPDVIEKFQNTTQTIKNSKGTSSSSRSKFKNTNQDFKNEEDFLEALLNQNTNIKISPISPLDDEKINPDQKIMLNQTSELNYQFSQQNLDSNIQKQATLDVKKAKNVLFSNEQSSVMQGNIINQQNGSNTSTNHYYSTKLVRGGQNGNNVIFTEQKLKVQPIFGQNKVKLNGNINLDINKKNGINFRSNFNFGLAKHVKPNQYSNFMLNNPKQNDQQINLSGNNPSNQILKQNQIGNINQQSSEMINGSLQKFGMQQLNTLNAQNSPQMSVNQKYLKINDSNTKMTIGNSSSQISSQLVVNIPFTARNDSSLIQRNKETNYRSVNISQKRISNIGEMDDTENTEYDEDDQ